MGFSHDDGVPMYGFHNLITYSAVDGHVICNFYVQGSGQVPALPLVQAGLGQESGQQGLSVLSRGVLELQCLRMQRDSTAEMFPPSCSPSL